MFGPKLTLFFSYWALALHQPPRDRVFLTYSCSHRPYGSNGVSYPPNPDREPPLKWPQSWSERDFEPFWGHFGPKISTGPTLGPIFSQPPAGLGEYDTPLELYARWLQEYAVKSRSRSGFERARAKYVKKTPIFFGFFSLIGL